VEVTVLRVTTPGPHFAPEYAYLVSTVLGEFLGAKTTVTAGDNPAVWRIEDEDRRLELPNLFFPEQNPEGFFDAGRIPHAACQTRSASDATSYAALFGIPEKGDAGLDIFGTIFFLLTSFEDHLNMPRDEHDRLRFATSWLGRNGLIQRPVVDELLDLLLRLLRKAGITVPVRRYPYTLLYTCDIDHPTLCFNASPRIFLRSLASSLIKRPSIRAAVNKILALHDARRDPYNTVSWICAQLERVNRTGCFFIKSGTGGSRYDDIFSLSAPHIQKMFSSLRQGGHSAGFHPGYATINDPALFFYELQHVKTSCPISLRGGRQHYLRFKGAPTWRMWAEAGLEFDSSLGFSAMAGFRCGTAKEFPVYDLERRVPLPLTEHPLLAMEVTLLEHMKLSHADAFDHMKNLGNTVRRYGGTMTLLWHNHTLCTDNDRELFSQTLSALA
jgi:hypothetical protein